MSRVAVTAGARGIGRAIASAFAARGDDVHVCDVDELSLSHLADEESRIRSCVADVSSADAVDRWFEHISTDLDGLDVLVNNAGVAGPTAPLEDINPREWTRTIDVNLHGAFHCAKRAIPLIKSAGGGAIVNISSTAGLFGYPLRAPYAASKWALVGLTKTLAMELGPARIRVNAVCPGSVSGGRIEGVIADEARARGVSEDVVRESFLGQVSMRTFVDATDVADTVLYLCSPAGAKISGQAIAVDGHTEGLSQR